MNSAAIGQVLLVGGTGVMGRRVLNGLLAAGYEVTANVRDPDSARRVSDLGARPVTIDLFDRDAVRRGVDGFDTVVNLATSIPTGMRAARRSAWKTNNRLRSEAAPNLAAAVPAGGRYVGESIIMSYVPRGAEWIDETGERDYWWFDRAVADAEQAVSDAADRGVTAVALRFGMFIVPDSSHTQQLTNIARRGWWAMPGEDDAYASYLHPEDGAAAVVAALDAPSGVYNVVEPDPRNRGEHADALAAALGRRRLRRLPRFVERVGGAGMKVLARSQRVSTTKLTDATGWRPRIKIIESWPEMLGHDSIDVAG